MIRIIKSSPPPTLDGPTARGGRETQRLIEAYTSGKVQFDFKGSIYGADDVKAQLMADQHRKCAYCEAHFRANSYGDVEHFRPKAGWTQRDGQPLQTPGYYWLAYGWSNLIWSCQSCNQEHKKNQFPLLNPRSRARPHKRSVVKERPSLVNPTLEDPRDCISFNAERAIGVDEGGRGEKSIKILGLNRGPLVEDRLGYLKFIRCIQKASSYDLSTHDQLHELSQPIKQFSAMVLDAVRSPQ